MTFKEFEEWCNERACDGCWGMNEALFCTDIIGAVQEQPRRKQEAFWQGINYIVDIEKLVMTINEKIKERQNEVN